MADSRGPAVRLEGFRELRRDLKDIDRALPRELNREIRGEMVPLAAAAAALAPKRSGQLARSIRPYATARGAGIRSRLPYANPIHWGWKARGIPARPFATNALEGRTDRIVDAVGDAIDRVATRNGFK